VTDEEFAGFRATCPPSIQIAMDLALLTGQRQGDILALRWDHIHADGIHIDQGKSGGERKLAIAISPAVEAVLARARALTPQLPREYVVHTMFGRRYTGDGFRALWQVYMRAWRKAHPDEARWVFHDLRAKCVSDTKNLQDASLRAGHADPRITARVYDRNRRRVAPLR
jgi:integrase